MFYPDPAYVCSLRAGGPTHFLAPGKGGSPLSTPSRPTPHDVGTSGVRPSADPTPLATASHRLPNSQTANGARSRRAASLYSVCHRTGRPLRANQTFVGARQLVRQDGWQAAIFGGRSRPSLLMVAHQLASASNNPSPLNLIAKN